MVNLSTHHKLRQAIGGQHHFLRRFVGFVLVGAMLVFYASDSWALDPRKALTQYVHDVWTTRDWFTTGFNQCHRAGQRRLHLVWYAGRVGQIRRGEPHRFRFAQH
jgi:hypothetical protein